MLLTTSARQLETHYTPEPRRPIRLVGKILSYCNKNRLMLNGPGGSFRTAVRGNGLLISIPAAATLGEKIVTITYRQGPEHRLSAASEDLLKVWRFFLKTYKPQNMGMFGCSAGGSLVSQTTAILIRDGLPALACSASIVPALVPVFQATPSSSAPRQ